MSSAVSARHPPLSIPRSLPPTKVTASDREATAIAVVATDAALTKAQAARLATMAHDGIARAIWPSHAPMDGDTVFAVSTGARPDPRGPRRRLSTSCGSAISRRSASRGPSRAAIYHATPAPGDPRPTYRDRFG
jgi:L-aminopeptidase/D-esterase-like protein